MFAGTGTIRAARCRLLRIGYGQVEVLLVTSA